ncbi:hypothetical protein BN11_230011 [Nostocoides australiense Ben110]|uniref:Uncharacterized protein n=1 Tax=Nostocoides australiense Ben110 TaxID=1193182 RepID=W6JWP1_9MICO|nr:hypothetical protein BN11_230011 [Tetrasphaera australiensis Ben110]
MSVPLDRELSEFLTVLLGRLRSL